MRGIASTSKMLDLIFAFVFEWLISLPIVPSSLVASTLCNKIKNCLCVNCFKTFTTQYCHNYFIYPGSSSRD